MALVSTFYLSASKQAEIVKDVVSVAMCHLLAVTHYYDCCALNSLSVADCTLSTLGKLNIEYFECCRRTVARSASASVFFCHLHIEQCPVDIVH